MASSSNSINYWRDVVSFVKKISVACVSVLLLTVVSGCDTVKGFGQDVEKGGKAISKAASKR